MKGVLLLLAALTITSLNFEVVAKSKKYKKSGSNVYVSKKYKGGGEATFALPGGNSATIGTNVFTGERRRDAQNRTSTYQSGGFNYYQMRAGTGNYNNGQTFLRVSNSQLSFSAVISGKGQMYSQNVIHDNFPSGALPRFSNSNQPVSLQFGGSFTH